MPVTAIAEQALRCARALTRLAETAQRAERQTMVLPPVENPVVKVERIVTPAIPPGAKPVTANCALRRRCRGITQLLFPGL